MRDTLLRNQEQTARARQASKRAILIDVVRRSNLRKIGGGYMTCSWFENIICVFVGVIDPELAQTANLAHEV